MDLSSIKVLVTHANCPDGIASALIVRDVMPDVRVVALDYGADRDALPVEPGMLFVDMSPPAARVQEFVDAGAIVLDHHKTARGVVEAFGDNGRFGDEQTDPGVCGAMLAFWHAWKGPRCHSMRWRDAVLSFATLAGVRDTWQREHPAWQAACEQAEYLRFVGLDRALELGLDAVIANQGWLGSHLWARKQEAAMRAAEQCYKTRCAEHALAIVAGVDVVSDVADLLDADLVAGFRYEARCYPVLHVSLRSRGRVDVGALAQRLGGGGHSGAAGYRIDWTGDCSQMDPFHAIHHTLGLACQQALGDAE